jgi:S1-C subfamily serine protease
VELSESERGVVVTDVKPDSPAGKAGLEEGDVIREVNRTPVRRLEDVEQGIRKGRDAKQVLLRVERQGNGRYIIVEVG